MKIAIHILIWVIALLFIGDQIIQMLGKGDKVMSSNTKANESLSKNDSKKIPSQPPPPPPDPDAIVTKAMLDNSLVEIEKAIANGSELIINGTITNQGTDKTLRLQADFYGEATKLYDDSGNKIVCNSIEVANQKDSSSVRVKLISAVKVPLKMRFTMPTIGGQTQARKITLLELWGDNNNQIKCEFRNLKIEKVGNPEPAPPTTPNPVANTPTPNPIATPAK